ncbi:hypothetical protein [Vibrio owensii]|uniref:hypothetical protein n=1 Tax=Vibrio owensii TaxID=696485 RepID=UPI0040694D3A
MGQYFKPIVINDDGKCIDLAETIGDLSEFAGRKFTEFCYLKNYDVIGVMCLLLERESAVKLIYCGDYAFEDGNKLSSLSYDPYNAAVATTLTEHVATMFDDARRDIEQRNRRWQESDEAGRERLNQTPSFLFEKQRDMYLINVSKKEYVSLAEFERVAPVGDYGLQLHPLPFLVGTDNGLGGGDYRLKNQNEIGLWLLDEITVSTSVEPSYLNITMFVADAFDPNC